METKDKVSVRYAFTVTLKPKRWFDWPAEEQYDATAMPLAEYLKTIGCKVTLVCELTKAYNVHYHGIITLPLVKNANLMKRFVDSFRRSKDYGFVNIKPIDNEIGWIEYINKSLADTCKSINRRPIIIDKFNVFDTTVMSNYGCTW